MQRNRVDCTACDSSSSGAPESVDAGGTMGDGGSGPQSSQRTTNVPGELPAIMTGASMAVGVTPAEIQFGPPSHEGGPPGF